MGRNSERRWQRRQQRLDSFKQRFSHLRRSPKGKLLGVFTGIAETYGFSVCWTRIVGCVVLLMISGSVGADGFKVSLLVAGFFYLLAAVLMRGPEAGARGLDSAFVRQEEHEDEVPPPTPRWTPTPRPAAVPYQQAVQAPRVDFAALDRQLDGLNRRIQRMEGIVTDRQYDWDRRMES